MLRGSMEQQGMIQRRPTSIKHRYFMPLDKATRTEIEMLRKPYPRPTGVTGGTASVQEEGSGSSPTVGLKET